MKITKSQIRSIIKEQLDTIATEPVPSEFYLLGYWTNAYSRATDREYFWSGPFDSRKDAAAFGAMKQKRGQPKRFRDWGKGQNKVFSSREGFQAQANKVGLNPRFDF